MVLVVDKMYRMLKNREEWTFTEPRMKDGGKGLVVIHDVAQALGCIRNVSSLPDGFVEDAPALLTRLSLEEEKLKVKQDIQMEATTSTEEASGELQPNLPKDESPGEIPPTSSSGQFPRSSAISLRVDSAIGSPASSPPAPVCPQPSGIDYLNSKKLPNRSIILSQLATSRSSSAATDQRSDSSITSHEPSIESASKSQILEVNQFHMRFINRSSNWSEPGFGSQKFTAMDYQRAPDLRPTPQHYYYQEQSPSSGSSIASSFSPTYYANSPSYSTVSLDSPTSQANYQFSTTEFFSETDSSSSSSSSPNSYDPMSTFGGFFTAEDGPLGPDLLMEVDPWFSTA